MLADASWFFWVWMCFVMGGILWPWYQDQREKRVLRAAQSWPQREARVLSVQVTERQSRRNRYRPWRGSLTYSYLADGVEVGEYVQSFELESEADEWARSLRGQGITVNVDPSNAARSRWLMSQATVQRAVMAAKSVPPVLGPISSGERLLRWVVLLAAAAGALLSAYAQISGLLGGNFLDPENHTVRFFGMHVGAMLCAAAAFYLSSQRFPGRRRDAAIQEFSKPFVRRAVGVLGAYCTVVFLWFWTRAFVGQRRPTPAAGVVMFSSIWLIFYVTAFTICWVTGDEEAGGDFAQRR